MNDAHRYGKLAPRLSWISHPARREPFKAALAVGVAIAMAVTVTTWAGLWLGALSFVVVMASVHGFLFPVWYRIFDDQLVVQTFFGAQRRPWSTLRRADAGKHGVHLSPFSTPNRLDGTRGIYVRFDDNRDEVMGAVTELLEAARKSGGETVLDAKPRESPAPHAVSAVDGESSDGSMEACAR